MHTDEDKTKITNVQKMFSKESASIRVHLWFQFFLSSLSAATCRLGMHHLAAVDVDRLAGDVPRVNGREENGHRRQLSRGLPAT